MKHSRFTDEQIIGIRKERENGLRTVDVCRKHGISEATFFVVVVLHRDRMPRSRSTHGLCNSI